MLLLEVESWAHSHRAVAVASLLYAVGLHLRSKFVSVCSCLTRERYESAETTGLRNELRVLLRKFEKSALGVCTSNRGYLHQVVLFDNLVLSESQLGANGVAIEGAEVSVGYMRLGFVTMIEATGKHLLCEGHEVRGGIQVPVLVGPEPACAADSSLNFVDNQINSKLFRQLAQALAKFI